MTHSLSYGSQSNRDPRMFGISLYQQKINELHANGRKSFSSRSLFSQSSINPTTPYLSQIPCSWGAIYFPSHWREFHSYLVLRLSHSVLSLPTKGDAGIVVQGVRSNRWTKSWKRYFIELVHLRGYVMLYPNYEGFLSFSTNHVEPGAHVKKQSSKRLEEFLVPLVALPANGKLTGLSEMPGKRMPDWRELPVVDFWGELTELQRLLEAGIQRREELTANCTHGKPGGTSDMFSVEDLKCPSE